MLGKALPENLTKIVVYFSFLEHIAGVFAPVLVILSNVINEI
jgi:hypothetical protein